MVAGMRVRQVLVVAGVVIIAALAAIVVREEAVKKETSVLPVRDPTVPVQVEARGIDRAWHFSYPGADGILNTGDDIVSVGDLTLPEGADVQIQLRSADYIYVFSCPGLHLKEIAVPDLEFALSFGTDRAADYDLTMDAMCGFRLPPGKTMGTLSIVSESAFQVWREDRARLR
jgi:heme/copper-type cytochrome/quinol oxidase subunit 2